MTPVGSLPASVDFGDVDCNAPAPTRTVTLPAVATGSKPWAAGVEDDAFTASPMQGTLQATTPERITVTPAKIESSALLEPIEKKLTVNIDATSQIVLLRMQPRGAILKFASANLSLQPYGPTTYKRTNVTNTGNAPVTLELASSSTAFTISPKVLTLASQASADVTVTMVKYGEYSGKALVTVTTGALCGTTTLSFTGNES